jgi:hypothetical protein
MITLIRWEANWPIVAKEFTADPDEAQKGRISWLEGIKEDINSGVIKMWGVSAAGARGFMVFEGDEKELFGLLQKTLPRIKYKVEPMISIDDVLATVKAMQQ